jgi:hypothetical protein
MEEEIMIEMWRIRHARRRMRIETWGKRFLLLIGWSGVACAAPAQSQEDDRLLGAAYRYYAFAQREPQEALVTLDLRDPGLSERVTWDSPGGKRRIDLLNVENSPVCSSATLAINYAGWDPTFCLRRVVFWWPGCKAALSPEEFLGGFFLPVLETSPKRLFLAEQDPFNQAVFAAMTKWQPDCDFRIQDVETNSEVLRRMRERYPDPPPLGVYVDYGITGVNIDMW